MVVVDRISTRVSPLVSRTLQPDWVKCYSLLLYVKVLGWKEFEGFAVSMYSGIANSLFGPSGFAVVMMHSWKSKKVRSVFLYLLGLVGIFKL